MRVKFGVLEQTQGLHLTCQSSSKHVHCVCFRWPKINFWQILTCRGLLYRPHSTIEGQIWCAIADPRYTLTYQISSWSVYSVVLCWWKTHFFAVFWTSAFSGVTIYQKVEHGCTTANLPLSNGIKIVSVLSRLHGKIGCTNSDVQKRDGQTDGQKNPTFLAAPAACEIQAPPNLAWW